MDLKPGDVFADVGLVVESVCPVGPDCIRLVLLGGLLRLDVEVWPGDEVEIFDEPRCPECRRSDGLHEAPCAVIGVDAKCRS